MAVAEKAVTRTVAVIVQQGKVLDFIDGATQREETPEEYVRQEIAKWKGVVRKAQLTPD